MQSLARIIQGWVGKAALGLLIAGCALAADGSWLSWHDHGDFDAWSRDQLRALGSERAPVNQAVDNVRERMDRLSAELSAEQERTRRAAKIIAQLEDLQSTWDHYVGNREQQTANAEQLARMTNLRDDAAERAAALQQEFKRTTWERDGLELARGSIDARLQAAENNRAAVGHYLRLAWHRLQGWIISGLALYYLGWPLVRFRRWLHADQG
ncbi:MAG: hypothetical protein EXS39_00945 [Opitutaceae bacterium]|nr:hypothetical protein [Opitutaceae bacterium]